MIFEDESGSTDYKARWEAAIGALKLMGRNARMATKATNDLQSRIDQLEVDQETYEQDGEGSGEGSKG